MNAKLLLALSLTLLTSGCISGRSKGSKAPSEVAQGEAGPKSDAASGDQAEKKADKESERKEALKRQHEEDLLLRSQMGICTHH